MNMMYFDDSQLESSQLIIDSQGITPEKEEKPKKELKFFRVSALLDQGIQQMFYAMAECIHH
jgi:hypothetical protein